MKPKILYQEAREASSPAILTTTKGSVERLFGQDKYSVQVVVTRYAKDCVILETHTRNIDNEETWIYTRLLMDEDIYDFAAIREGIKTFNIALAQFEIVSIGANKIEPD